MRMNSERTPEAGVPYCKDSPRSTLPMQAKSCSDGCNRLWMSDVLLEKSCGRGRRACRLREEPASGRSACLLRRSGIRPPRLFPSVVRHPAAARRRETGYCHPDVEGRRPPGPRPPGSRPPVRTLRSAPLRPAPLRSAPHPACSAPRYAKKRSSSSRAAMSDSAMRRLSFDLSV